MPIILIIRVHGFKIVLTHSNIYKQNIQLLEFYMNMAGLLNNSILVMREFKN